MHGLMHAPGLASGLIALIACTPATPPAGDAAADAAVIRSFSQHFVKAYSAGDADAIAALYAEDAVVSVPDAPAVRGRAAIREYWASDITASAPSGLRIAFGPDSDVGLTGDLGWESGSLSAVDGSGAAVYQGKYLTVFRKTNGKWFMLRDIWNSDAPLPATPAAGAPPK